MAYVLVLERKFLLDKAKANGAKDDSANENNHYVGAVM